MSDKELRLPELDGHAPDWAALDFNKSAAARGARQVLGATKWSEDLKVPPPPWLLPGLLQSQAIHVISAPKGCRKTWLGLAMMLAGIYNKPVLNVQPTRAFNSLYIGADSPRWDIRGQLRALAAGLEVKPQIITEATSFITPYGPKFTEASHRKAITDLVISHRIDVIFVDVLLYVYDGLNENDNTDMGRLYQVIKFFRDNLGCAVVLLHHHAKGEGIGARGAGTITQAAEHHFELTRKGDVVTLFREKLRGDEDQFWVRLPTILERHNGGRRLAVASPALVDFLLESLSSGPHTRAELVELATQVGFSPRSIDRALATLRTSSRLTASDGLWSLNATQAPA